jgi:molecular chaperone DnaK (HSP70)
MVNREAPAIGIDLGTTYSCVGVWQNVSSGVVYNARRIFRSDAVMRLFERDLL